MFAKQPGNAGERKERAGGLEQRNNSLAVLVGEINKRMAVEHSTERRAPRRRESFWKDTLCVDTRGSDALVMGPSVWPSFR